MRMLPVPSSVQEVEGVESEALALSSTKVRETVDIRLHRLQVGSKEY